MRRSRRRRRLRRLTVNALATVAFAAVATIAFHALADAAAPDRWLGLAIAPEHRCSPYDQTDYRYPQSVEAEIVASMGGRVYGPYTGRFFLSMKETDVEHTVAVSEAHDSGLCAAGPSLGERRQTVPGMSRTAVQSVPPIRNEADTAQ